MPVARGIIHSHSRLSYDGLHSLEELRSACVAQGFQFIALTEHSAGLSREMYADFVRECRALSSAEFVVIPGLEILCPGGIEIAGVGLEEFVEAGEPVQVARAIANAGGFSIWVHPQKRAAALPLAPYGTHAIELLNGKEDGAIAPNLHLWKRILAWRKRHRFLVITGLDLHTLGGALNVWTECRVGEVTAVEIKAALLAGKFSSIVSGTPIASSGGIASVAKIKLLLLRVLYLAWNYLLQVLPDGAKDVAVRLTRPIVKKMNAFFHNGP